MLSAYARTVTTRDITTRKGHNGLVALRVFRTRDATKHVSVSVVRTQIGIVHGVQFRKAIVWLVGSRLAGTLLAQFILVPSAGLIAYVAGIM